MSRAAKKEAAISGFALSYSVEDAASVIGIGRSLMFELVAAGQIKSIKIGRRRVVTRAALESFLAKKERAA